MLLKKKLNGISSRKITVMGTSFKPNTDDIRDSISIKLIKKLLKKKSKITVYDPKALENTKKIFGDKICYENTVIDALSKSQCAIFMTHWKEFEKIDNKSIRHMKRRLIIDCRRIFAEEKIDAEYYALGIGQ